MDSTENSEVVGDRLYQAKKYERAVNYFTKVGSNTILQAQISRSLAALLRAGKRSGLTITLFEIQ